MPGLAAYQKQLVEKFAALKNDLAFLKPNSQDIWAEGQQVSVLNQGFSFYKHMHMRTCTHTDMSHTDIRNEEKLCQTLWGACRFVL